MIFRARKYRGEHQRDVAYAHITELVAKLHQTLDLNVCTLKALEGRRPIVIVGAPLSFWKTHWRELEWHGGSEQPVSPDVAGELHKRFQNSRPGIIEHEEPLEYDEWRRP